MRTRIKFCGCTNVSDAQAAIACGVDAIGVIFALASPRRVSAETARAIASIVPAFVSLIGVFVEPTAAQVAAARAQGYIPQFSGRESAELCESAAAGYIKVFHLAPQSSALDLSEFDAATRAFARATPMLDTAVGGTFGGTGQTFHWEVARPIAAVRPLIVGGGLTPDNVGDCVRKVRPFGVDVRSGIETAGVKDPEKMRAFVRAVKEADAQT